MAGSFGLMLATIGLLSMTEANPGRIQIPATHRVESNAVTGLQRFKENGLRGLFYVPRSYNPNEPLPLLILLHGGGRNASDWFGSYSLRAERGRFIVVAPDSFGRTWGSNGDYGPDVLRINAALAVVSAAMQSIPAASSSAAFPTALPMRSRWACSMAIGSAA